MEASAAKQCDGDAKFELYLWGSCKGEVGLPPSDHGCEDQIEFLCHYNNASQLYKALPFTDHVHIFYCI